MAMMECPECGKEVSDKAAACPNCGAPIAAPPPKAARPGREPDGVSRSTRSGGAWEAIGFLLIVAGMLIGMAGNGGLGWALGLSGFVVFLVGRFK
ncbi:MULTISPECIES: zinc ribbon domain-containing protein [unclassified Guyparkeria]|uniref:zinc ribbon domain-containing protein n=1 Tax=unclassified Guyparkeria TaxID=2626246 RepID=UPI00073355D3|nr:MULTISPECIES: zinc ribbon domain-containing protein [unclassified Guyparkeria]KTG17751.1 hypothetical protein AUR63_06405 [Guyparkeria sp. XI15]OAE89462.1 hypothetical protein AWR35_06415 [Guyparkeria sp. WRN-7]